MALHGAISNLRSLVANLLPAVNASAQAPSSSSSPPAESPQIESDLECLMKMLDRIKSTLYDAEEREIRDRSVKLWLRELKGVAFDAEDMLSEYHYEVLRAQVEARDASAPNFRKRKRVQMPYGMSDQIKQIKGRFDEICKHREDLRLSEEDGPRRCNSKVEIAPIGHFIVESDIFGREKEKKQLIDLLSSECHDDNVVSVVTIVGTGGLGKTTLAQLVYNDQSILERFDIFGWVCVSDDFNVQRLMRESVESITGSKCDLTNLSALQKKIGEMIRGERVLLVLDDVWNENKSHWELFLVPFRKSTALVKILVTTRNESVARIMQTVPSFNLEYLSEEQCRRLFQHYAFGKVNQNGCSKLVEIGKQIMKKCGKLPLAVKSIASLLRHEAEEGWKEILESELWESDASNEIFAPLQISYVRLPTYLKPCFLYCSMFPKDYECEVENLVQLWIYQGYIESNGKKKIEKIGQEYAKQLWERSFFDSLYENGRGFFKLHDMVHDLARLNSENECYSIEAGKAPDFRKELYHLYVDDGVKLIEPLPYDKFTALRTLIVGYGVEFFFSTFDFSKAHKLRALELRSLYCELEVPFSVVDLKHLRYLSLGYLTLKRLPECICSLYSLQNLKINDCKNLKELPNNIGNLVSLQELVIILCCELKALPVSLCQLEALKKLTLFDCSELEELPSDMGSLTNLQTLEIRHSGFSCLPPSLSKVTWIETLHVSLQCETIGWLKDFSDFKGTLSLLKLDRMPNLTDVQCANLVSMHNLKCLKLNWGTDFFMVNGLKLDIINQNTFVDEQNDFSLMDKLQPHPNLEELHILVYSGITFPKWIANPTACASLERIVIGWCGNLTFLPFGSLCKLKYLEIYECCSLPFLQADSLPSKLQELHIFSCKRLISVPGIQKLKSLVKLCIRCCENLQLLVTDVELTTCTKESSYQNPFLGLRNLTSLRSLQISSCPKLRSSEDGQLPVESCEVEVFSCPGLKDWCLQHNITYKDGWCFDTESESKSETEADT